MQCAPKILTVPGRHELLQHRARQACLDDDPIGIVALSHFVESAGPQNAVYHEEDVVKQDAAQAHDVVDAGAVGHRAQRSQIDLQARISSLHCHASKLFLT